MEDVLYTTITSTNSNTAYKIMLNSSFNSKHKHHVHVVGDLKENEIIYHISRFDDQLSDNTSQPSRIGVRSECTEYKKDKCEKYTQCKCEQYEECKSSLPEKKHAYFINNYVTSHEQRGRCDDIIIYNDCIYFFELKTNETLPNCHIFQQLQSSKKILYQSKINLSDIPNSDIQTYDYKFILCIVQGVVGYIHGAFNDDDIYSPLTVTSALEDEEEITKTNFNCRHDNIIITCQDEIVLNNLA